jgi:TonB family protein
LSFNCIAQSGTATTDASPGLPVNGALATTQSIDRPSSVAPDGVGGFYVSSPNLNRIYHVAADGKIRLAAGNGLGFGGDGGPATAALLNHPHSLAVDSQGNLYIADTRNNRVRKVTAAGVITTVAGNGEKGFGGDGGQAASAQLGSPFDIAVDSAGNLYIADITYPCIRKVTSTGMITIVAGNGKAGSIGDGGQATSAQLHYPYGIAVDSAGNLFIADSSANRIRKVTSSGIISTVAGNGSNGGYSGDGGPATATQLNSPDGIAVDSAGNLYFADHFNNRIRKINPAGVISTLAGYGSGGYSGDGGQANSARLKSPGDVALDSAGNLYISDDWNSRIRKVTPDGVITTVAGNGKVIINEDFGVPPIMTSLSGIKPPVLLSQMMPLYTQQARDAKVEGIVVIRCSIRTDGNVDRCKVLKGLGYGLDESAIDTVQNKWKFKPATSNGAPVEIITDIEVRFRIF